MEELPEHSKEVAKGSLWTLIGSIAVKLSSFVYVILLARAASQDDVGIFYLTLGIMSLVSLFSDLGISAALVRYIPYFLGKKEDGKVRSLLELCHMFFFATGLLISIALYLSADWIGLLYQNPVLPDAIRIMSIFILISNIFRLHWLFLQGIADIKGSQLVQNLQNILKLVLTAILFYLFGASVFTISVAFILSYVIVIVFSSMKMFSMARVLPEADKGSKAALIAEIAPLGIMLTAIQYFSVIIASADRLLLGYFVEPSQSASMVAIYSISTTLAAVLMIFPASVGAIFLPVVSRLVGKNEQHKLNEVMETAQRWTLFMTLPIAVVMIAFSGEMLGVFYGASYVPGAAVMAIFTLGITINAIYYLLSLALAAMRLVKIELEIAACAGGLNLILNIILIPLYGMEGAAVASVASFILALLLSQYFGKKLFGFSFPKEVYKLSASAILVMGIMLLLKPYVAPFASGIIQFAGGESQPYLSKVAYLLYLGSLISISLALFVVFSLALKCIKKEDITLMKKAMARSHIPHFIISFAEKTAMYGLEGR